MQKIGEGAGLSRRTAITALIELEAMGWIDYQGTTGKGVRWRVKQPPKQLRDEAVAHYKYQLDLKRWRLELQRLKLELRVQVNEREDLEDQFDALKNRIEDLAGAKLTTLKSEEEAINQEFVDLHSAT